MFGGELFTGAELCIDREENGRADAGATHRARWCTGA